jgi:hypothetical protein
MRGRASRRPAKRPGLVLRFAVYAALTPALAAWNALARLGCDIVQGYYLSRPVPAESLELAWREPAWRAAAS